MHIVHQIELHAAERADTKSAVTAARADVALVSMPFGPLFQPSLGLSLLKAALTPLDLTTRVHYFTLRFAELIFPEFVRRVLAGQAVDDLPGLLLTLALALFYARRPLSRTIAAAVSMATDFKRLFSMRLTGDLLRPGMTAFARIDFGRRMIGHILLHKLRQALRPELWMI